MINKVVLIGRLVVDVDLKYTGSGNAVGTFNLAVNRNYTNNNGEREADFIRCVIWRKNAENLANYTRKGSLIGIDGRLQTRSYDNDKGERVYVTEVIIETFQLLESLSNKNVEKAPTAPVEENTDAASQKNTNVPTNNKYLSKPVDDLEGEYLLGNSIDIMGDEFPF